MANIGDKRMMFLRVKVGRLICEPGFMPEKAVNINIYFNGSGFLQKYGRYSKGERF